MKELIEYVRKHTTRGDCVCGKCIDAPAVPMQPGRDSVDMMFFKVAVTGEPDAETLKRLIYENRKGDFCTVDLFDGIDHSYIEVGAWIGDQGLAMMFMALGVHLGLFMLLTPRTVFKDTLPDYQAMKLAQQGFVSVQQAPAEETVDVD